MSFNTGWKFFEKKNSGGRFKKYDNQMVVIFAKGNRLYLSKAVVETLKDPAYIGLMTRGSNVALVGTTSEIGYKVRYLQDTIEVTPHMTITKFVKEHPLQEGVYDCHVESGPLVVFDTSSAPSKVSYG